MPYKKFFKGRGAGLSSEAWPGRGMAVGHAAAPGWPGAFTGGVFTAASPNHFHPTEAWAATFGGTIPGGTLGAPITYSFIDFDCGSGGTNFISRTGDNLGPPQPLQHVRFVGCRFKSSNFRATNNVDCAAMGSDDIGFQYCTFCPSVVSSPPGGFIWPSASTGTGEKVQDNNVLSLNAIPYNQGVAVQMTIGGSHNGPGMTIDRCDFWGHAIACVFSPTLSDGTVLDGLITFTNNWVHDHRNHTGPLWDLNATYNQDDCVSKAEALDGEDPVYRSKANGNQGNPLPGPDGPLGRHDDANWEFLNTHDHADGILPAFASVCRNYLIQHNTFASIANGQALAFQSGGPGNNYWQAPEWSSGTGYFLGARVTSTTDKNMYQSLLPNDNTVSPPLPTNFGNDPTTTGGISPKPWLLLGPGFYDAIQVLNNYLTGYGVNTHLGPSMLFLRDFVFKDNVFTSELFMNPIYTATPASNTRYAENFIIANGCLWRNNKFRLLPVGAGAGYASSQVTWDDKYQIPSSSLGVINNSTADWGN